MKAFWEKSNKKYSNIVKLRIKNRLYTHNSNKKIRKIIINNWKYIKKKSENRKFPFDNKKKEIYTHIVRMLKPISTTY